MGYLLFILLTIILFSLSYNETDPSTQKWFILISVISFFFFCLFRNIAKNLDSIHNSLYDIEEKLGLHEDESDLIE